MIMIIYLWRDAIVSPKTSKLPQCYVCGKYKHKISEMTDMWKPGSFPPDRIQICTAGACWSKANELGYSSGQRSENPAPL
jgi:hypothetical protein